MTGEHIMVGTKREPILSPVDRVSEMPCCEKSEITTSSISTTAAWVMLMPLRPVRVPIVPDAPVPLMLMPRSRTVLNGSLALAALLVLTPSRRLARIDPNVPGAMAK